MQRSLLSLTFAFVLMSAFPTKGFALSTDTDLDSLDDATEIRLGTNPNIADTDGDGLWDGAEIDRQTNPLNSDTDEDGESDGDEVNYLQDPLDPTDSGISNLLLDCESEFSCDNGGGSSSCDGNNDNCSGGIGIGSSCSSSGKSKGNNFGIYLVMGCILFLRQRSYRSSKKS